MSAMSSMRGGLLAKPEVKQAVVEAVVTRADGTVVNLGAVSYWHRNPIKRWWWHLRAKLEGRR